jgi:Holliday junction resolvase RusA-like endonuclease
LPSLNDYTAACRSNAYVGAKFKKEVEEVIGWYIKQAVTSKTLTPPKSAVMLRFEWREKTKRRDADNIASAKKFILDALVTNGILKDDSRKYVKGFYDVIIDDKTDFVRVGLIEI